MVSVVRGTHKRFRTPLVISLVHDGVIEVIKVEFSLQRYLVVCFKKVESECRFWAVERRRVPTHTKELAVVFAGDTACSTLTKSDLYFVPTVGVDDREVTAWGDCGA